MTHIEEEKNSDADDERVIQDEASKTPQVVQVLEDDSERKRSCLDDVPTKSHFRKFETTLDQQNTHRNLVKTLVSDTEAHDQWIPASMRGRPERPQGRRVLGLRVRGLVLSTNEKMLDDKMFSSA